MGDGFREAIAEAWTIIPAPLHPRLGHVHFLTGTDPVYAGLHPYEDMTYGRSYRSVAHCAHPVHTSDRSTTVVLPVPEEPWVIVHELAHALDYTIGRSHQAVPVTWYAATNRAEAFAESFVAWLFHYGDQDAFMKDAPTRALFDGLTK